MLDAPMTLPATKQTANRDGDMLPYLKTRLAATCIARNTTKMMVVGMGGQSQVSCATCALRSMPSENAWQSNVVPLMLRRPASQGRLEARAGPRTPFETSRNCSVTPQGVRDTCADVIGKRHWH